MAEVTVVSYELYKQEMDALKKDVQMLKEEVGSLHDTLIQYMDHQATKRLWTQQSLQH